jgi:CheY-like chemotaxis protein
LKLKSNERLTIFTRVVILTAFYFLSGLLGKSALHLSLPGMDCLAATKLLKADPAPSHLQIIALTAHAMRGDDALAKEAGCDGCLTNPIDTRRFPEQIASFIHPQQTLLRE